VTHRIDQTWRVTETNPAATADIHIWNNVAGANTSARIASATTLANAQMVNMRAPAAPNTTGISAVLLTALTTETVLP
jgi:hypothetical protein